MNIQQVIKSVERLHGGERDQLAKHREYLQWLKRQQEKKQ